MSQPIAPMSRQECVEGNLPCGQLESVNLKFYQEYPNVGDQFSLAVAQHYFSPNVTPCNRTALTVPNVILIGSFLHYADAYSHICGAGFIAAGPKYMLRTAPKSIHCVRGPLTGHLLEKQGMTCPRLYADPGILAPVIYPQSSPPCSKIGVIPHYVDADSPWVESCRQKGLKVIDVFLSLEKFFEEMNQCEVILTSSLHGIIFAHAYGKPALWIELSDKIIGSGFKFYDYYLSVGVKPEKVDQVRVTEKTDPCEIAKRATVQSHAGLYEALEEAMDRTIQQLKKTQSPKSDLNSIPFISHRLLNEKKGGGVFADDKGVCNFTVPSVNTRGKCKIKKHGIYFIVGCGRSGTHYLARIIDSGKDVFVTYEEPDIFRHVVDHVLLPNKLLAPAIKRYKYYHERHFIYVDKSHPNLFNTGMLLSAFPEAKFIGIYRNVFETVASMLKHKKCADWGAQYKKYKFPNGFLGLDSHNLERYETATLAGRCAFRWFSHYSKLMQLNDQLKDRFLLINYADLIEQNEMQIQRIGEFLNVPLDCIPPDKKCRDKWKTQLTFEQQQEIQDVLKFCGMEMIAGAVVNKNAPDDGIRAGNSAKKVYEKQTSQNLSLDEPLNGFQLARREYEIGNMLSAQRHIQHYQTSMDYKQLNPVYAESCKSEPLFSVVIVTHNRPEDVVLCIDYLRRQEFNDYEVIVVDNSDADKKADALAGDVDVYVDCPINFNPSEARNIGAYFAKGEILVFLDDDALVGPGYLVSIQEAFKQYEILGLRGKILPKNGQECSDRVTIYDLGDKPMSSLSTIEGNTAFRRDAYRAVGGMDALLFGHEGIDLSYRLMQLSGSQSSVIYWPEAIIHHDYGGASQFAEKESRYQRNRNYLKYKYDIDIIGLKEKIQTTPLKSNQSGRLLPPFRVAQPVTSAEHAAAIPETDGPKVSIVMACHNAADFLAETMNTILAQTLTEWELLITDDGSTDATRQILETYAAKDQRIQPWFFDDKKGPYVRRNFMIEQAQSPFICIQDADDLMAANKLEILYEEINRDEQLGIVGSYYRRFLDIFRGPDFGDRMEKRITHEELMAAFPNCWHLCWHGSAIIRKSLFDTIGLYDEQPYGSDTFWLSKAGLYGLLTGQVRFKNLPEFLTYKREHAQSQTGKISPVDPRSRRHRLERYYLQKLQQISDEASANPSMVVAQRIKECTCTDFIPKFGHLFDQWESAPVNDTMIQGLIDRGLSQFSSEQYVSALITLNYFDQMVSSGCQSYRNLNFTRGLAYYAGGDDECAIVAIQKEIQYFQTQNARIFSSQYLSAGNMATNASDRRANIRRFIAEASKNRMLGADPIPPQEQLTNSSPDLQEKLATAKQYLYHGQSEKALCVYQGLLSDNTLAGHIELKEKLTKLVEGIHSVKMSQTPL